MAAEDFCLQAAMESIGGSGRQEEMEKTDEEEKTRKNSEKESAGICFGVGNDIAAGKCKCIFRKYGNFCKCHRRNFKTNVYRYSTFFCSNGIFKHRKRYGAEI